MNSDDSTLSKREKAKAYLKNKILYENQRYIVFALITIFVFALPFIQIDGNQIFLLSFDHKQLHLLGVSFDMQELYLMPFLIMFMFLSVFFITTLAGRVWCGWGCPHTIFRIIYRDLIETKLLGMRRSSANKQKEPDMSKFENKIKKVVAILIWSILSLIAASNFMWYFVPPADFFVYMSNPLEHTVLLTFVGVLTLFLIFDIIFIKENFCIYVCPYSRVQSTLYDNNTIMTVYDYKRGGNIFSENGKKMWKKPPEGEGECTGCESCVKVCPTHIDIRKGMQLECINCLECSDACAKVMAVYEKPSLIGWTSPEAIEKREKVKYFRITTIAYIVALVLVLAALAFMSGKKEYMLLNINRTTELYVVKPNNIVENSYVFLFQNTDSKDHEYFFEIVGRDDIDIVRPKGPFLLKSGSKQKVIVVLSTNKKLSEDGTKDTPLPITIRAFALDAKERIVVDRNTVFFYPKEDELKK